MLMQHRQLSIHKHLTQLRKRHHLQSPLVYSHATLVGLLQPQRAALGHAADACLRPPQLQARRPHCNLCSEDTPREHPQQLKPPQAVSKHVALVHGPQGGPWGCQGWGGTPLLHNLARTRGCLHHLHRRTRVPVSLQQVSPARKSSLS